jgi:acyl-CoA synthetase (AMP-forming)/AMP-acid ligase II
MVWRPHVEHAATVPALLRHAVERWGDHELVVTEDERLTYREADSRSAQLAKHLITAGVGKATRVATHFPYGVEWIVTWLAISRVGALHMPFSTAYKPAELRKALALGDARILLAPTTMFGRDHDRFVDDALSQPSGEQPLRLPGLPFLREVWFDGSTPLPWASAMWEDDTRADAIPDQFLSAIESEVTPADLAITIFTSGTTSVPKAVTHSHDGLVRKGTHLAEMLSWRGEDRIFCGMPYFWVGGIAMTVVPAIAVGATLLCVDRTEPLRSLDLMERERATRMTGWPGVRGPIMAHPTRPGRDIPALEEPPTGFGRQGSIGMTESLASYTWPDFTVESVDELGACMGRPIDGCEIRISDTQTGETVPDGEEGAILIRGYLVMQGIYKREREDVFAADGFYDTGDTGVMRDGLLYFRGRHTEMIKTSGNNVAPPEVEAVLRTFAELADAHVLGVSDPTRGEVVAALVVPNEGEHVDPEEIRERARKELSNYKVPSYVVVVEKERVPWLATGKPDRLAMKEFLAAARPTTQS